MYRYFCEISYNGTDYCGWQIQPNGISVQETLNKYFTTILRENIELTGAGRTDAGVHAKGMTAHFDVTTPIVDIQKFISNINNFLPPSIAINIIYPVKNDAHSRFSALSRRYEYHIIQKKSPFFTNTAYKYTKELDIEVMNMACEELKKYSDFTSFSKVHTDVKTFICSIKEAYWIKNNDHIIFTIEADRFLRNMVRAIVGTMLDVGTHKISISQFKQIIESKNRCNAGHSVPACGLFFIKATYPDEIYI